MKRLPVVFKRQLVSFLSAPTVWLGIALFLAASTAIGFQASPLLDQGSSDLHAFFRFHPWLYLLLIPFLCTHLWSDESPNGAMNFLNSLPLTVFERVIGKFLAAWVVSGMALLLTFPLVIAANAVGTPDNIVIASQYLASWLLAGSYLAAGCFICTFTHKRLAIFMFTSCLLLITSSLSSVLDALDHQVPIWMIDALISLSPPIRFAAIDSGLFTLQDSLYFISMTLAFLSATTATFNYKNG